MKPVPLIERAIRNSTDQRGSGARRVRRQRQRIDRSCQDSCRAVLVELDRKFCDVIRARWERFQAKSAGVGTRPKKKERPGCGPPWRSRKADHGRAR